MKKFVRYTVYGIFAILITGLVVYRFLPREARDPLPFDEPQGKERNIVKAGKFVVVAGTPWASQEARKVLENGGNACDAAVTALLMLNVTYGEAASFPSVAPLLYYNASTKSIRSYSAVGTAPQKATIKLFKDKGHDFVPRRSILAQLIPASPDMITALLNDCGSKSFTELSAPAIQIAREGFPVHNIMMKNLNMNLFKRIGFSILMPYNAEVFVGGEWWRELYHGDRFKRLDLADTLEELAKEEQRVFNKTKSRKKALNAVRTYFYKGPIAKKILDFHKKEDGLFTANDLANYQGAWDTPISVEFGPYTIYTNPTYTQGIALLEALKILETKLSQLKSMMPNSPVYIHTVVQAIELAMADRERFAGDPKYVRVPVKELLSESYARERALLMQEKAFPNTPPAGNPWKNKDETIHSKNTSRRETKISFWDNWTGGVGKDTSYISIIDQSGNSISMTPSDFPISPMVPDTGITLGIRMTQFHLDPNHPSSLQPGKRPRITPHAVMVFKNGSFYMSCGSPGGEMQTQATLQFLMNHLVYGMDIQEAVQTPRFRSRNWPDSFSPHEYLPHHLDLEKSLEYEAEELHSMGYSIHIYPDWDNHFGAEGATMRRNGVLWGASDPREETWAVGE